MASLCFCPESFPLCCTRLHGDSLSISFGHSMIAGGRGMPGMTHSLVPGEDGKVWLSGSQVLCDEDNHATWGEGFPWLAFPIILRAQYFIIGYCGQYTNSFCGSPNTSHCSSCLKCSTSFLFTWKSLLVAEWAQYHLLQEAFQHLSQRHWCPLCILEMHMQEHDSKTDKEMWLCLMKQQTGSNQRLAPAIESALRKLDKRSYSGPRHRWFLKALRIENHLECPSRVENLSPRDWNGLSLKLGLNGPALCGLMVMGWEAAAWNHPISMVCLTANLSFLLAECLLVHRAKIYCALLFSGLMILMISSVAMVLFFFHGAYREKLTK